MVFMVLKEKKYLHELPDEEFVELFKSHCTFKDAREKYAQPEWCSYPNAIDSLGCWSLIDDSLRNRIRNESDCSACSLHQINGMCLDDVQNDVGELVRACGEKPKKILLNPEYERAQILEMAARGREESTISEIPVEYSEGVDTFKVV